MKTRRALLSIFMLLAIVGCSNEDNLSIPTIDGLSLYWDHQVFGDEGRRLRFEGYTTNDYANDYDLVFNTSVVEKTITVRLTNSINKGKCPIYPMPGTGGDDPTKCNASGEFYIPDTELENGIYSLNIIMPSFEITSELTVTEEKVTLAIPTNTFLKSSIENVYPIPPDLLFGNLVYQGSSNTIDAENFLAHLTDLGLIETSLPNYPYRHLTVDENGNRTVTQWEPDNHSIGFLFNLNNIDFKTIIEEAEKYFNRTDLNIYLYTSNGDEGRMSKNEGITVVYANN